MGRRKDEITETKSSQESEGAIVFLHMCPKMLNLPLWGIFLVQFCKAHSKLKDDDDIKTICLRCGP